ncbi:MAG: ATP-binding protein, partial [Polyangiaceae bacterium]
EAVFVMPPSGSLFERAKRSLGQALNAHRTIELLGEQKIEIQRSFEALHRASEEFHALLERLPDLVVIHREGTILWVNRAIVSALGQRADELIGKPISLIVHDSSIADLEARMRLPPDTAGLPDLIEVRLRKPDGQVLTIEVAPAQNVTFGGASARLVVGRDVTDRVRIQQQLVTADRLASLGLLAAGVAHEINNPLAYVLGNSETIGRSIPKVTRELSALDGEDDPERVSAHLASAAQMLEKAAVMQKTALEGCLQMRLIVGDLKTFSRADEDALGLVDVRWSLDAATNIARSEIEKRARLVTRYGDVPLVRANESRLGQVFLNLLVNAAQAIPDGDPASNEVRIATMVDALGKVVIEISDTGPGIAAHEVARVFDPFFTTKPAGVGTGLGLSICHGIVAGLGGAIEIASSPGQGATFRVTLPAHPSV